MQSILNRTFSLMLAFCLAFALSAVALAAAQQAENKSSSKTVTGCLQKGDEAGEFSLTTADGKTYGLRSSAVDLSAHLGHKVTVTGNLEPEQESKESKESEKEAGDIQVQKLKMVSDSCK